MALEWLMGLAMLQSAPAQAPEVRACGTSLPVSADSASFADAGRDGSAARLARLSGQVAALLQAKAVELCEAGFLGAQDFVGIRTLVVQNGEGAAEPILFRESGASAKLVFQYAFTVEDAPDATAVEQALRCWRRPDLEGCYQD